MLNQHLPDGVEMSAPLEGTPLDLFKRENEEGGAEEGQQGEEEDEGFARLFWPNTDDSGCFCSWMIEVGDADDVQAHFCTFWAFTLTGESADDEGVVEEKGGESEAQGLLSQPQLLVDVIVLADDA